MVRYRNYSYHAFSQHEASHLDFDSTGSVGLRLGLYEVMSSSHYKRGYISQMDGVVVGKMDVKQREILLEVGTVR